MRADEFRLGAVARRIAWHFVVAVTCLAQAGAAYATESAIPPPTQVGPGAPPLLTPLEAVKEAGRRKPLGPDDIVESFQVKDVPLPTALKILSDQKHVLCGIEVVPWGAGAQDLAPPPLVSISVSKAKVKDIVQGLVVQDPRFVWLEDNGVINLLMRSAGAARDYPLNAVVSHFQVDDWPYATVLTGPPRPGAQVPLFLEKPVYMGLAVSPLILHRFKEGPRVTLETREQTVRAIANRVARQVGMSWSLEFVSFFPTDPGHRPACTFCMVPWFCEGQPPLCCKPSPSASTALVPVQSWAEAGGLSFEWNKAARVAVLRSESHVVTFREGSDLADVDGRGVPLAVPIALQGGRLFAPEYFMWAVSLTGRT